MKYWRRWNIDRWNWLLFMKPIIDDLHFSTDQLRIDFLLLKFYELNKQVDNNIRDSHLIRKFYFNVLIIFDIYDSHKRM